MKLTRTDVVFSRAACMVFLCAGLWIFRCLRKFQEKSQKIHEPEGSLSQKGGQRGPKSPAEAATPMAATGGRLGRGVPPSLVPYVAPYFYPSRRNARTEVLFPIYIAEPPPPSILP